MSFYDMSWLTEAEGLGDAVDIQLDLMSPFNAYQMVREPSLENLIKSAYMPAMAYLGYYGASALVGEAGPGFWVRQAIRYENLKHTVRAMSPVVRVVPYAPAGAVLGGTIHAIETGDTRFTLQHWMLTPAINWWLGDLGKNDSRGGSEYGLFYNP